MKNEETLILVRVPELIRVVLGARVYGYLDRMADEDGLAGDSIPIVKNGDPIPERLERFIVEYASELMKKSKRKDGSTRIPDFSDFIDD
jgi:hypothetical protein